MSDATLHEDDTAHFSTLELDREQIEAFERDGFLSIDSLTTVDEAERLRAVYDRLFEADAQIGRAERGELARCSDGPSLLPQILNPDRYAPELRESSAYRNVLASARQLLGPQASHMGMHAIRKPPRDGAETPWHQDEAYWDPDWAHRAISVWMPLQPATLDNGCMHFVPGSHLLEVQEHQLIDQATEGLELTDDSEVRGAIACPLPPGGATVHANRTLHYAGANRTDEPRRALIMAFEVRPVRLAEAREFPWQPDRWYEEQD